MVLVILLLVLTVLYYANQKNKYEFVVLVILSAILFKLISVYKIDYFYVNEYKTYFIYLTILCYVLTYSIKVNESVDLEFLILTMWLGSLIIITCNQLILIYLALELQTFSIFILIASRTLSIKSSEGALKYFILGALSSGLFLFSLVMTYLNSGELTITSFNSLNYSDGYNVQTYFLIFSMFFKLSLFPIHFWVPDIYEGCTDRIMGVIGTFPKISVLGFLIQLNLISNLFLWCALGSILVGTIGAMNQSKLKRLLAYSGITHIGMGVIVLSVFSKEHLEPVMLYFIIYTIGFMVVVLLMRCYADEKYNYLYDLSGIHHFNMVAAITWSLCLLSAGGIPPLSGFLAKWWVLWSLLLSDYFVVVLFCVFFSILGMVYYLRVTQLCYLQKLHSYVVWNRIFIKNNKVESRDFYLGFIFYFICFLVLNPNFLVVLIENAIVSFF